MWSRPHESEFTKSLVKLGYGDHFYDEEVLHASNKVAMLLSPYKGEYIQFLWFRRWRIWYLHHVHTRTQFFELKSRGWK